MKFKIALAQINTVLGSPSINLDKHLFYVSKAKDAGVDLIIFPELSLTGYSLKDLTAAAAINPSPSDPVFSPLFEASEYLDLVVGFVDVDQRKGFYAAAAYLSGGKLIHTHHKVYLPTYGMFDEGRFFAEGDSIEAFDTSFGRAGIAICEDFWHASLPYVYWLDGVDLFVFTSASPGYGLTAEPKLESAQWVELINQAYAKLFTSFVIHVNRVGFEDGLNFWGGSTVFEPGGNLLVQGPYFEEALVIADIDMEMVMRARLKLPLLRDERPDLIQREIDRITKNLRG